MVLPIIARIVGGQVAKKAVASKAGRAVMKREAAKNAAKNTVVREANTTATNMALSASRKRYKRRIASMEKNMDKMTSIERERAQYVVNQMKDELSRSYLNRKTGKYDIDSDTFEKKSRQIQTGTAATREERMTTYILNTNIGKRIYGGLEAIWNKGDITGLTKNLIDQRIVQFFETDSMSDVLKLMEKNIPGMYETTDGEMQFDPYRLIKTRVEEFARNFEAGMEYVK